ncbi:MAG TPA: sugar ABC transporter permease, partial [Candidatus Aerophobetes bacterium]|nr:sugar ABC transporter permease [Candidatus Aerophobetes bacterium]
MKRHRLNDFQFAILLILPAIIFMVAVMGFPFGYVIRMSFCSYDVFAGGKTTFIGLKNFFTIFSDPEFFNAFKNTLEFTSITVFFQFLIGMGIALLLNQMFKGRAIIRTAVLLPWALPTVINSLFFKWMFDGQYGVFNDILLRLHLVQGKINWLGSPITARWAIYLTQTWKVSSLVGLILLAGLQAIPSEVYEAAKVDGAGKLKRFLHITLPLLKPSILIALIFRSLVALQVFDVVFAMTRGGPGYSTETLVYNIYRQTFVYSRFGYGSALSV